MCSSGASRTQADGTRMTWPSSCTSATKPTRRGGARMLGSRPASNDAAHHAKEKEKAAGHTTAKPPTSRRGRAEERREEPAAAILSDVTDSPCGAAAATVQSTSGGHVHPKDKEREQIMEPAAANKGQRSVAAVFTPIHRQPTTQVCPHSCKLSKLILTARWLESHPPTILKP